MGFCKIIKIHQRMRKSAGKMVRASDRPANFDVSMILAIKPLFSLNNLFTHTNWKVPSQPLPPLPLKLTTSQPSDKESRKLECTLHVRDANYQLGRLVLDGFRLLEPMAGAEFSYLGDASDSRQRDDACNYASFTCETYSSSKRSKRRLFLS